MSENRVTIRQELTAAGRGVIALIVGDRQAPRYFDLSLRGLVGSFIALLVVAGLNSLQVVFMGGGGSIARSMITLSVLFAAQTGFAAIALRQMKRPDGFVPYLVTDNWTTFFITLGAALFGLVGFGGDLAVIVIAILALITKVNIGRLIVTLSPLQIAMFIIAQTVGACVGLLLLALLFPLSPAELAALSGSQPP